MEILSFLSFLILIALLIIIITYNSGVSNKLERLIREVNLLKSTIQKIEEKPANIVKEHVIEKSAEKVPGKSSGIPVAAAVDEKKISSEEIKKPEPAIVKQAFVQPQQITKRPTEPKKIKQNTDFEKFIGENLISKIGILILILGVGFFVKYAIDKDWINEYGRTAIGLLVGGALVGVAHYMRKEYKTFSSLLTGGGIAVFYLTIAIAFHQYQLFSQTVAFIILVVITIFSVILSLIYDKRELAIFSQIGGYAAPFMVSTGEGNYIILFTYMLILNTGLIALSYYKRWHVLNLLAFIFTLVIYSSWLGKIWWDNNNPPYLGAFIFASLFYLVFFLVNILNNLKERKTFNGIEITMIISNNLFYFISGLYILHNFHEGIFKGLFTVLIGLYNFGWVLYLYRKQQIDKNFIFLLIGLVMSFISIAVPIQLNGHSITLFWTAEFVILLWLAQKSKIKILKIGHLIVLVMAVISLIMDWSKQYNNYNPETMTIVFNQIFVTGIVTLTGLVLTIFFIRKETDDWFVTRFVSLRVYKIMVLFLLFIMAYLTPYLELRYQMNNYYSYSSIRNTAYGVYNFAYLFSLLLIARNYNWGLALKWLTSFALVSLLVFLVFYNFSAIDTRDSYLYSHSVTLANVLFHYLIYPFVFGVVYLIFRERNKVYKNNGFISRATLWILAFFVVFVASVELDTFLLITLSSNGESVYSISTMSHKAGYPILWGIATFIFIWWGIKVKVKDYRIIALSLLGVLIVKLFIDVWNMSYGGRIAAFILLGIIMLVISFLYQKLKRFISEEDSVKQTNEN